jgi:hypothetical protein
MIVELNPERLNESDIFDICCEVFDFGHPENCCRI